MFKPRVMIPGLAATVCLLVMLGCDVRSKHPLSDEKTSKPDVKLLGDWREQGDDEAAIWRVTKHPKFEKAMMAFPLPAEMDGFRDLFFTTTIGGKKYFSWGGNEYKNGILNFCIYQYEMPDENTLHLYPLSVDAVRQAIVKERLAGEIKITTEREKGFLGKNVLGKNEEVCVTASPKELREFIKKHADACFKKDKESTGIYKRL